MEERRKALFRALTEADLEVKVQRVTNDNVVHLAIYKNGVIDSILLDEKFTPFGWKKENKVIVRPDGTEKMMCVISVKHEDEWISKDGVGTESDFEAEKGQETDAMKRAGYVWGIGRELKNHSPKIFFEASDSDISEKTYTDGNGCVKTNKWCYHKFSVVQITYHDEEYDDRRISRLAIRDDTTGKIVFQIDNSQSIIKSGYTLGKSHKTLKEKDKAYSVHLTMEKAPSEKKEETLATAPTPSEEETPLAEEKVVEEVTETDDTKKKRARRKTKEDVTPTATVEIAPSPIPVVEEVAEEEVVEEPTATAPTPAPSKEEAPLAEEKVVEEVAEVTPAVPTNPKDMPVNVGKFKSLGNKLSDLNPREVRWVYKNALATEELKKACYEYAKMDEAVKAEFIKSGIAVK